MTVQELTTDRAQLAEYARRIRIHSIRTTTQAGSGHPTTCMSMAEILSALFFAEMRWNPSDAAEPQRDRLILSKGHGVPAVYAALAEAGAIPMEELSTLRETGSRLQGHPDPVRLPFTEAATGSLGQGLSIAMGLALAAKLDGDPWRVWCLLGDGEIEEGQVWEAAMSAPRFNLDNLCAIVDANGIQQTSSVAEILPTLEPIADKWRGFGWNTLEIDGHDLDAVLDAFEQVKKHNGPSVIVARTKKGRGVSFMEDDNNFHGKPATPEQAEAAIKELTPA